MRSFERLLEEAEAHPVHGWDFSWLRGRLSTSPLPWDFDEILLPYARRSPDMLDMGTGGDERLAAMTYRPPRTVATEAWPPNVDLAGARLRGLGVTVVAVNAAPDNVRRRRSKTQGRLPFPSDSFALISNRHESFLADEIKRVLAPGGTFVTQQIGGDYGDFYEALGLRRPRRRQIWNLVLACKQIEAAGLRVTDSGETTEVMTFADVGALAWFLKAAPWTVHGFSISSARAALERAHARIKSEGPLSQLFGWLRRSRARRRRGSCTNIRSCR